MKKIILTSLTTAALFAVTNSVSAQNASDDFEDSVYSSIDYGDDGGVGLGAITYLEGSGGGIFAETGSRNIDSRSFGVFAGGGNGNTQGLGRTLDTALTSGTFTIDVRFDVDNSEGFSGFNLKSALGSSFGGNELLSIGLTPGSGNDSIFVGDSGGSKTINLGSNVLGAILNFEVDFDAGAGTYIARAKFDSDLSFTAVSGNLIASSTTVGAIGWGNFNTGNSQNLISDNLTVVPEPGAFALLAGLFGMMTIILRRRSHL